VAEESVVVTKANKNEEEARTEVRDELWALKWAENGLEKCFATPKRSEKLKVQKNKCLT
jgi:hypothetical protein